MAQEFSREELADYSLRHGNGYETIVAMHPYWRSFLLEEHERAHRDIIEGNSRSHTTLYRFAARVTGIEISEIEAICQTGDFISIIPNPETHSFQQFMGDEKHGK